MSNVILRLGFHRAVDKSGSSQSTATFYLAKKKKSKNSATICDHLHYITKDILKPKL